jgi:hypothetical protein
VQLRLLELIFSNLHLREHGQSLAVPRLFWLKFMALAAAVRVVPHRTLLKVEVASVVGVEPTALTLLGLQIYHPQQLLQSVRVERGARHKRFQIQTETQVATVVLLISIRFCLWAVVEDQPAG